MSVVAIAASACMLVCTVLSSIWTTLTGLACKPVFCVIQKHTGGVKPLLAYQRPIVNNNKTATDADTTEAEKRGENKIPAKKRNKNI